MLKDNKFLIVITGPTAVGKTKTTINLANALDCEIISCDSRQFYREMSIGTAKPTVAELNQAKHHFIDSLSITDDYSAGEFERDGLAILNEIFQRKDVVILSGGSGLYIKALCEGFDNFPDIPKSIFDKHLAILEDEGLEKLQRMLAEQDPQYHQKVDLQNSQRIIRALSVAEVGGRPYSSYLSQDKKSRNFQVIYLILERDRSELYARINDRVDHMLDQGLLDEVKNLIQFKGYNSLQTVGYQELIKYLEGKAELTEAVELIKRNSRRYAKRQITWFRRIKDAKWIDADDYPAILTYIQEHIT